MPTPQPPITPRLFLPGKGYPVVPSKAAPFAPKPPDAPRGTTEDSNARAQSLALEQWANSISAYLDRIQTSVIVEKAGLAQTSSGTYTETLTGVDTVGPIYPDPAVLAQTLFLPRGFALGITVTANVINGYMGFNIYGPDASLFQAAGDNLALANVSANGVRASAVYNYVVPTAGPYQINAAYRSFDGTPATFSFRQLLISGSGSAG